MKKGTGQAASGELAYEIYGSKKVSLVIEAGLGASTAEWRQLAERLSGRHTVLLYQRAGYAGSGSWKHRRTPENIARELYRLLEQTGHGEKVTLVGHSQGGLYAWKFTAMYPKLVERLVLLDPISPEDYRFRTELSEEEFRKSGADKTAGLRMNLKLIQMHLGWLVRMMMRSAPPFYYYDGFNREEKRQILSMLSDRRTYQTALAEYEEAHNPECLEGLLEKGSFPDIPVTVITHSSQRAEEEIRQFGGATEEQAKKTEALWQSLMQTYLSCVRDGTLLRAENSSHYIHLTDSELLYRNL